MMIFGLFHLIPAFGDIAVDGLFWWVMILFGLFVSEVTGRSALP